MKNEIIFSPEAQGHGTGWFDFDPQEKLGWSFEETVARINRLAEGQDLFDSKEKTSFDAAGFIHRGPDKLAFIVCDWREDKRIHVLLREAKRPKGFHRIEFVVALGHALKKVEPREFKAVYTYSEDVFSWPPTPTKEEAINMARNALEGFLGIDDWNDEEVAPKSVVGAARAAIKALGEAFE